MFSVPHLIIIFAVALMVFGPEKLPELARTLGKVMGEFRRATGDLRSTFEGHMRELERESELRRVREAQPPTQTIGGSTVVPALPVSTPEESSSEGTSSEDPLPPAPGRESQEVAGIYAPKSLAQLVGTWAYSAADCERLFQRRGGGWAYRQPVDKFAQAAIVEPKRILLPSATCRVESASEAEGALKVSAECADSITYTSRSVMISLRSATELLYSASGRGKQGERFSCSDGREAPLAFAGPLC